MSEGLNFSRRLRRTPYTSSAERAGVRGYSVVNHMLLPKAYQRSVEEDYRHLRKHVQVWDVSCQRQVQITGPESKKLIQWMTPRDISHALPGDCMYLPLTDERAGLINDPVMLMLSANKYWLSIADSDVLLFAKGLALGRGLSVSIEEPDVSPLAVQGPKAEDTMVDLFGEKISELGFFKFDWFEFKGTQQLVARSGYSRQGGFEIYLQNGELGSALWDAVMQAGQPHEISPGCPNLIERIEGGLLSYGNEMTRENNPLEIGLSKYCVLDDSIDYLGFQALSEISQTGVTQEIRGVVFDGGPCPTCAYPWPLHVDGKKAGAVTSAIWSPRMQANVGLAMIKRDYWEPGQLVLVQDSNSVKRLGRVTSLPISTGGRRRYRIS